jgi:hypothetical protein
LPELQLNKLANSMGVIMKELEEEITNLSVITELLGAFAFTQKAIGTCFMVLSST